MSERSHDHREESPQAACAALIQFLGSERDLVKRQALAQDLTFRASYLEKPQRERIDRFIATMATGPDPQAATDFLESAGLRPTANRRVDLALFGVQPVEWRALRDVFGLDEDNYQAFERRRRYYSTTLKSRQGKRDLTVIVSALGRDTNVEVGPALSDFALNYDADAYCLIGMAAGVRDQRISLGDVVCPETVFYYEHARSIPDGEEPRYQQLATPDEIGGNLLYFDLGATSFEDDLRAIVDEMPKAERPKFPRGGWRPRFHFKNAYLGAGEKLIADGKLLRLKSGYDQRTIAGDEESYGFAASLRGKTWAIFRGIADYGDPLKEDGWQYLSTCAAALVARHFFVEQYIPPDHSTF